MSFAGDENDVTGTSFRDCERNGFVAIRFDFVFCARALQADHRVVDDGERIFAARIVGGQYGEIAAASGSFTHERALGPIAVSTAAEERKYSASTRLHEFAREGGQVAERVVGVGVIHDHGERLAAIDALKAPG